MNVMMMHIRICNMISKLAQKNLEKYLWFFKDTEISSINKAFKVLITDVSSCAVS